MIAKHYGRNYKQQTLNKMCQINREGVSLLGISDAAEKIGFRTLGVKLDTKQLKEAELPCILHWRQYHFVVLYKIKNHKYYLADPAAGLVTLEEADFKRSWEADKETTEGIALLLAPTPQFYEQEDEQGSAGTLVIPAAVSHYVSQTGYAVAFRPGHREFTAAYYALFNTIHSRYWHQYPQP